MSLISVRSAVRLTSSTLRMKTGRFAAASFDDDNDSPSFRLAADSLVSAPSSPSGPSPRPQPAYQFLRLFSRPLPRRLVRSSPLPRNRTTSSCPSPWTTPCPTWSDVCPGAVVYARREMRSHLSMGIPCFPSNAPGCARPNAWCTADSGGRSRAGSLVRNLGGTSQVCRPAAGFPFWLPRENAPSPGQEFL